MQSARALPFLSRRAASAGRRTLAQHPDRWRVPRVPGPWRTDRPTGHCIDRTNLIAAPFPASTHASRRPPARSTTRRYPAHPSATPRLMPMPPSSRQSSTCSTVAQGERLRHPDTWAPARRAARDRRFRLSSGQSRSAAEFRRPRAHRRGAARGPSPGTNYAGLTEEARIARLLEELATARPLTSPFLAYPEETHRSWRSSGPQQKHAATAQQR